MPELRSAIVLAAGFGKRMRPFTDHLPKPLIPLHGKPLLSYVLDALEGLPLSVIVVNTHYKADMMRAFLQKNYPDIIESYEPELLETGGGVANALPLLGEAPFLVVNSDTVWQRGWRDHLLRLLSSWHPENMDALLTLIPREKTCGYEGKGDYIMHSTNRITHRREALSAPFVYAGAMIIKPEPYRHRCSETAFGNLTIWAELEERGTLAGMIVADDIMCDVGTPEGLRKAEVTLSAKQ